MPAYNNAIAKCPKCGEESDCLMLVSWNTMFGKPPKIENKCHHCNNELTYKDVVSIKYIKAKANLKLNE